MIRAALEDLVLSVDGCCAAVLVAPDGVAVDSIVVDEVVDSELLAAGAADLLARSDRFTQEAGPAPLDELNLITGSLIFLARPVGHDYRLLTVLGAGSDWLQARDQIRRTAGRLQAELAMDEPGTRAIVDPGSPSSL